MSSVSHAQSNGRAEVCVKSIKRLLRTNTLPDGGLDTDAVMRGLLQLRNTPDPDTNLSPAQIVLGRTLRDFLPLPPKMTVFDESSPVRKEWKSMWHKREDALKNRMGAMVDRINSRAHNLEPLRVGDFVHIQNQYGNNPTRWDKTGVITEVRQYDQYMIRVHGSRRLTARNRRFLKKFIPLGEKMMEQNRTPTTTNVFPAAAKSTPAVPAPEALEKGSSPSTPDPLAVPDEKPVVPFDTPVVTPPTTALQPVELELSLRRSTRVRKKPDFYGDRVES